MLWSGGSADAKPWPYRGYGFDSTDCSVLIGMNKKRLVLVLSLGVIRQFLSLAFFLTCLKALCERGVFFQVEILYGERSWKIPSTIFGLGRGVVRFTDFDVTDRLSLQHSHNVFIDTIRFGGIVGVILLVVHLFCVFQRMDE